jgi:hypothetical protein
MNIYDSAVPRSGALASLNRHPLGHLASMAGHAESGRSR